LERVTKKIDELQDVDRDGLSKREEAQLESTLHDLYEKASELSRKAETKEQKEKRRRAEAKAEAEWTAMAETAGRHPWR